MSSSPKVSVIMAVYNGEQFLRAAVNSILNQTLSDLEFVIVDDGSTDYTGKIIQSYTDGRIKYLKNSQNIGLTRSLNIGIRASQGEFIARQDADDTSNPERLKKQYDYLNQHPDVGLVGSAANLIDKNGLLIELWPTEIDPIKIQQKLLNASPFRHGTWMFRRICLAETGGGYDEKMTYAQDCDLLFRISEKWELANLPEFLYDFRIHDRSMTSAREADQLNFLSMARQAAVTRRLKYGWARLGWPNGQVPDWVRHANRNWLTKRYVWWSASTRMRSRWWALQFLIIASLLDPFSKTLHDYICGIFLRKSGFIRFLDVNKTVIRKTDYR